MNNDSYFRLSVNCRPTGYRHITDCRPIISFGNCSLFLPLTWLGIIYHSAGDVPDYGNHVFFHCLLIDVFLLGFLLLFQFLEKHSVRWLFCKFVFNPEVHVCLFVCLFVCFWWDIIRLKWQSILTSSRSDSFSSKKTSKAQCVYEQSVTPCVTRIRQCWMLIIYLFLLWSIILRANSSQNGAQIWKLRQAWKLLKQSRVHLPSTFYPIHFWKMTIVKDLFC